MRKRWIMLLSGVISAIVSVLTSYVEDVINKDNPNPIVISGSIQK